MQCSHFYNWNYCNCSSQNNTKIKEEAKKSIHIEEYYLQMLVEDAWTLVSNQCSGLGTCVCLGKGGKETRGDVYS